MKTKITTNRHYNSLVNNIGTILETQRKQAIQTINQILVKTYWQIGRQIVEFEQKGKTKADYGSELLNKLSMDLKLKYGR